MGGKAIGIVNNRRNIKVKQFVKNGGRRKTKQNMTEFSENKYKRKTVLCVVQDTRENNKQSKSNQGKGKRNWQKVKNKTRFRNILEKVWSSLE